MNQKRNNRSDQFWNGNLSLEEEKKFLEECIVHPGSPVDVQYARFVFSKQNETCPVSEDQLWNSIQQKNRKRYLHFASVAASFLIIVATLFFIRRAESREKLQNDFALLEQTLRHVSEGIDSESQSQINVLYEDEWIVIVSENL